MNCSGSGGINLHRRYVGSLVLERLEEEGYDKNLAYEIVSENMNISSEEETYELSKEKLKRLRKSLRYEIKGI